jgi:hypothetical protein
MKTSPEPESSSALPNSHLDLIYYIEMSSPNSLGRKGHPFMGHLYLWSPLRDNEIRVYGMPPTGARGLAYIAL